MEEQDSIYTWLMIIAFAGLLIACLICVMDLVDLKSPDNVTTTTTH